MFRRPEEALLLAPWLLPPAVAEPLGAADAAAVNEAALREPEGRSLGAFLVSSFLGLDLFPVNALCLACSLPLRRMLLAHTHKHGSYH